MQGLSTHTVSISNEDASMQNKYIPRLNIVILSAMFVTTV